MTTPDFDNLTEDDWEKLNILLQDPVWRIENLYWIKNAKGHLERFKPTPEQCEVINAIHFLGITRIIILKARQLGMSTVIDVILADFAIWNAGFQGTIVDENQAAASIKLTYKVVEAFNSMPAVIRDSFTVQKCNSEEFTVLQEGDLVSVVFAGKGARGGTNQFIHISEWGPIQHGDPARSDEIMNGAIPSAKEGIIVVETTWMGGKHGHLWELTERAMALLEQPENMTRYDFHLFFFAWYVDPQYSVEGNMSQIPPGIHEYFRECEAKLAERGKPYKFTDGQKLWYYKEAMPKGAKRFAEFPTLIEECFMAPVPGAVFNKLVDACKGTGRVRRVPHMAELPVFTFWDLGAPQNTRVTYVQFNGLDIHIIDHDGETEWTPAERVGAMRNKGYSYGGHFMPHDAETKDKTGKNYVTIMNEAGLEGIRVIPKCRTIWPGINRVAELFPRFVFDEVKCKGLLEDLTVYRTKTSNVDGHQTDIIVEGKECHGVDTVRMLAESIMNMMLKGYGSAIPQTDKRGGENGRGRQRTASAGRYQSKRGG